MIARQPGEASVRADAWPGTLPRLIYFADVPVDNYMHGSALVYRLLETYPADQLLIVEGLVKARPEGRLPGVEYRAISDPLQRLLHTRFGHRLADVFALRGGVGAAALERLVRDFSPEAMLTVIHGYQWQSAAAYCRKTGVPLHVIAHDRWQNTMSVSAGVEEMIAPRFTQTYRMAASRFCVSPHMAEVYQAETGVPGGVLYPARRRDFQSHASVSQRVAISGQPFTVAYAGSIPDAGVIEALSLTAKVLATLGGRLVIFGPYDAEQLTVRGLKGENIVVAGPAAPHELADRLRAEADLLVASVSFAKQYLPAMEMCFPSKLTDYTAAGLPIVVHGPPSCSAVRWAKDNPDVAEIVETMDEAVLRACLQRLMSDAARRAVLARTALAVGARQFAGDAAEQVLLSALTKA